jgi:glycosyltransferase involved in cell wall biosynthesis
MKFSIITPTFNSERYLGETIESVLSQKGDFEIEHIIVDNWSQDNTIDIVKHYQRLITRDEYRPLCNKVEILYYQERDSSMYDAINLGFSKASGDIFAWINSDDIYLPGAFSIIIRSLQRYPEIQWIKGITSYIDEWSSIYEVGNCLLYDQDWIRQGMYGRDTYFIQQDSVFWQSKLWKTVGGIDGRFKKAGDYYLWMQFSRYAPLYSVRAYLSCFRKVKGQISQDLDSYRKEIDSLQSTNADRFLRRKIGFYFGLKDRYIPRILHKPLYALLFRKQKLFLIDTVPDGEPKLSWISYYVAD